MPIYSEELQDQLARIDSLQQQIDTLRPLPADVQARIFQKFRLDWNYHSNSIEGNSLTYGETVAFIMEGVTAKGKPLKDHLDLRGHNQAIDVLQELIKNPEMELTERDIRELHSIIMAEAYEVTVETSAGPQRRLIEPGQYKTMPNHTLTSTGETHYYATPEETPGKMHDLIEWYRAHRATLHPLVLAAQFHHKFVAIHPFDDGNGRMTRLLTNMLLMKAGYPPVVVKTEEKREYYAVLSQADAGVEASLLEYFAERLIRSLDIYLKGARGEDIAEPNDLEKEVELFKKSFEKQDIIKEKMNPAAIFYLSNQVLIPLFTLLDKNIKTIGEIFFTYNSKIVSTSREKETEIGGWLLYDSKIEYTHPMQTTIAEKITDYVTSANTANKKLLLIFNLEGFKKYQTPFNVKHTVEVLFNEFDYTIESTSFLYHYHPNNEEIQKIALSSVRRLIDNIKGKTNTL